MTSSGASSSSLRPPGLGGAALLLAHEPAPIGAEHMAMETTTTMTTAAATSKQDGKREAAAAGLKSPAGTPEHSSSSNPSAPPQVRRQKKGKKRLDLVHDVTRMSGRELVDWQPGRGTNEWHTRACEVKRRDPTFDLDLFDAARVTVRQGGLGDAQALICAWATLGNPPPPGHDPGERSSGGQ